MNRPNLPTARDVMTRKLIVFQPEMSAHEAAAVLVKNGISGAPVADKDGTLLGVLSEFDCLRAVASGQYLPDGHAGEHTVGEIMTDAPLTISPEMDLYAVAHEFVTRRVRRLPVLENGKLVGQVSRRDLFRALHDYQDKLLRRESYPDYPTGREPISDYPE